MPAFPSEELERNIANHLLRTLFEIGRDFSGLLLREQIVKTLSLHLMGQLLVSRFSLFMPEEGRFACVVNRLRFEPSPGALRELLSGDLRLAGAGGFSDEARRFLTESGASVIFPMKVGGEARGLLLVGAKMNGEPFSEEDIRFIEILGNIAISALENERLFKEEITKKRLESELALALEIQRNLLPKAPPELGRFEIYGESQPSRLVGGDYFDFIKCGDRQLIAIGDVSGKGMPAALLMANVQAALRALAPLKIELRELARRLNELVYSNTSADQFITLFLAEFDPVAGELTYLNAGHNPPALLRPGERPHLLREGGIILGFDDAPYDYKTGRATLRSGDFALLYTDGITEATGEGKEDFGAERLFDEAREAIARAPHATARDVALSCIAAVRDFADSQSDDMTIVVLKAL